jgi:hypothetical protein
VEATFTFWKSLETAHPELKNNWRWQMLVLRAYYDTYTRRRLIYEQGLEKPPMPYWFRPKNQMLKRR